MGPHRSARPTANNIGALRKHWGARQRCPSRRSVPDSSTPLAPFLLCKRKDTNIASSVFVREPPHALVRSKGQKIREVSGFNKRGKCGGEEPFLSDGTSAPFHRTCLPEAAASGPILQHFPLVSCRNCYGPLPLPCPHFLSLRRNSVLWLKRVVAALGWASSKEMGEIMQPQEVNVPQRSSFPLWPGSPTAASPTGTRCPWPPLL